MTLEPKPGLVIRFDYLWRDEQKIGFAGGKKDRPCVVVVTTKERDDGSKQVMVCPITHSPPHENETAVEIPPKLAKALSLDHDKMWIKTHELNSFAWEKGLIPVGVVKTPNEDWSHGMLPFKMREKVLAQVRENNRRKRTTQVRRDE